MNVGEEDKDFENKDNDLKNTINFINYNRFKNKQVELAKEVLKYIP